MTIYVLARERRKMTDDQNSSKKIKVPSLRQDPGGGTFLWCIISFLCLTYINADIAATASDLAVSAVSVLWDSYIT